MPFRKIVNEVNADTIKQLVHYEPTEGKLFLRMVSGRLREVTALNKRRGVRMSLCGNQYQATHIIWLYAKGKWPDEEIDHIDCNPLNNALENLREASHRLNNANKRVTSRGKSGVKGVVWDGARKKWAAYLGVNYKTYNLGRYDTIEEAKAAYDRRALEVWGEFARQ